jgi:hypothetical protein
MNALLLPLSGFVVKTRENKYWFFLQKTHFSLTKLLAAFNFLAIVNPKVEDYLDAGV